MRIATIIPAIPLAGQYASAHADAETSSGPYVRHETDGEVLTDR